MDIKQFMLKISESDLRKEVRKEYANVAVTPTRAIIFIQNNWMYDCIPYY